MDRRKGSPTLSSMRLLTNLAMRIFGPWRSPSRATWRRAGGEIPYQLTTGPVLVGRSMREVQAGDVDAGDDELLEDFRRIAGRAEGGDDLGTAINHAVFPLADCNHESRLSAEST